MDFMLKLAAAVAVIGAMKQAITEIFERFKWKKTSWNSPANAPTIAAILAIAHAVGGYHQTVFQEGNEPAKEYQAEQSGFFKYFEMLKLEMAIPRNGHKHV